MSNNLVDIRRTELVDYFNNEIIPYIKLKGNTFNHDEIESLMKKRFKNEYYYWSREYGNTLRVSATVRSVCLVYFLTYTPKGKTPHNFGFKSSNEIEDEKRKSK